MSRVCGIASSFPSCASGSPGPRASRGAHNAAARMSGRSAHPQVVDRRLILRKARHRAQEEQLLQREFALKNVSLGQPEFALQIERRHDLATDNNALQVRSEFCDGVNYIVAKGFALVVPRPSLSL